MTKPDPKLGIVTCRAGHVYESPANEVVGCRQCDDERIRRQYPMRPPKDASIIAAYRMGGLEAAHLVASERRDRKRYREAEQRALEMLERGGIDPLTPQGAKMLSVLAAALREGEEP